MKYRIQRQKKTRRPTEASVKSGMGRENVNKKREQHRGRRCLLPGELEQVGPAERGEGLPRNKAAMPLQGRGSTEGRAGAGQHGPHVGRVGWEERPADEPKDGMETGTGAAGLGSQARPGRGLEEPTLLLLG